jgi:hypothetical protein
LKRHQPTSHTQTKVTFFNDDHDVDGNDDDDDDGGGGGIHAIVDATGSTV